MVQDRLVSLDFFRGATVIAMIIVNNPGSWNDVYSPLLHAPWNGCTPTDLIFPFFLFIVGVSISTSMAKQKDAGLNRAIVLKILRRAAIIFLLGMWLAWFTWPLSGMIDVERLSHLRIPGVLQRISIVYGISAFLFLSLDVVGLIRTTAVLLIGYYFIMVFVPLPDGTPPNLEPGTNLAAWTDRMVFGNHLWSQSKTWDPEGALSTLPAVASCLLGIITGHLMKLIQTPSERVSWMFFVGVVMTVAGLAWSLAFPMNKSLWTSSYVLYTGGLAIQVLTASHLIIDIHQYQTWTKPFIYFGMNAIFAFVASGWLVKFLIRFQITGADGTTLSLWSFLYQSSYSRWLEPRLASLCFAMTLVAIFYLVLRWMYKRRILLKV